MRRLQDRWVLTSQKVPRGVELSITNTKSTKTVIEMTSAASSAILQTNPNFQQIESCMDFVMSQLVRFEKKSIKTLTMLHTSFILVLHTFYDLLTVFWLHPLPYYYFFIFCFFWMGYCFEMAMFSCLFLKPNFRVCLCSFWISILVY